MTTRDTSLLRDCLALPLSLQALTPGLAASNSRNQASQCTPYHSESRRHDGQRRIAKLAELTTLPRSLQALSTFIQVKSTMQHSPMVNCKVPDIPPELRHQHEGSSLYNIWHRSQYTDTFAGPADERWVLHPRRAMYSVAERYRSKSTLCRRCVTPGMKAVRRTADVPTLLKNVSGPELVMLLVNS